MPSALLRSLVVPFLLALLVVSLGPTPVTQAATVNLNVDRVDDPAVTSAGVGAAACSSTTANDCSLRGAILKANAAVSDAYVINLPSGTYTLTLTGASEDLDKTGDLDITRDVAILGAGAATTVIDGNNSDRVLEVHAGDVTISGVTIRGGKAPDGAAGTGDMIPLPGNPGQNGGGILNASALTLTNSIVTANHTGAGGAGSFSFIMGMTSSGGSGGLGGGIHNSGTLLVISTTVSSNGTGNGGVGGSGFGTAFAPAGAPGGFGGDGGGIYNSGTLTVAGTIVKNNNAGNGGNGGAGSGGNSTFASGASGGSGGNGGNGGGIFNSNNMSLSAAAIANNVSGYGGQGGNGGGGLPAMALPAGNGGSGGVGGSGGNGSAIFNAGHARVTNSTLSGNIAGNGTVGGTGGGGGAGLLTFPTGGNGGNGGKGGNAGNGGIYNGIFSTAIITITSSTIASNSVGPGGVGGSGGTGGTGTPSGSNGTAGSNGILGAGGGVAPYTGTLTLNNTILALNSTSIGGLGPDCYGAITSQGYNFIRVLTNCTVGGTSTGNISGVDPKLGPLADNGGGTLTRALQAASPARNAGDPAGCKDAAGNLLSVDQRGLPRSYGGRCDMGAYELQSIGLFLPLLRR